MPIFVGDFAFGSVAHSGFEHLSDSMSVKELLTPLPNDHVMGNRNSSVVMIEYASATCMHCADFNEKVMPKIEKNYIENGKILFIYRDYPLDYRSLKAAMLGFCYDYSSYFKYQKAVFASIDSWSSKPGDLGVLSNIAKVSNIDQIRFNKCINDEDAQNYVVQQKFLATKKLNIDRTPTVFINGSRYEGMHDFEFFAAILDELLQKNPNYSPIQ